MANRIRFIRDFALPIGLAVFGTAWAVWGVMSGAYDLYMAGLSRDVWMLIGYVILLIAFLAALYTVVRMIESAELAHAAPTGGQHFHNSTVYINPITPELAAINPASVQSEASPSVVVAQPDAAPPQTPLSPIEGQMSAVENGNDTLAASGQIFSPTVRAISPLYVGQIIISAAQLADGSLEIAVRVFNGSREIIELASVHGAILAGINNAAGAPLPTPTLRPEHVVAPIPPGTEFMVILDQPLPGALAQTYLDGLDNGDRIAFDLRELRVLMRAEDDANLTAPLPLWHGASISRRDDIFTNRIFMASVGVALDTITVASTGTANGK